MRAKLVLFHLLVRIVALRSSELPILMRRASGWRCDLTNQGFLCLICVSLLAACGNSSTDPIGDPTVPVLEPIDFDVLGSGKVLFHRLGEISSGGGRRYLYLIDGDARLALPVFQDDGFLATPALSPGSDAIAYLTWTDLESGMDIYTRALVGGAPRRLTTGRGEGAPTWLADGSGVLYFRYDPGAEPYALLYEIPLTTGVRVLLQWFTWPVGEPRACPRPDYLLGSRITVSNQGAIAFSCADGLAVAASRRDPPTTRHSGPVVHVAWSEDGRELAFVELQRLQGDSIVTTSLKVLDLESGAVRPVAVVPGSGDSEWVYSISASVCWIPGTDRIVFTAVGTNAVNRGGPLRGSLYVVRADGSGLSRLTTDPDSYDSNVSCAS